MSQEGASGSGKGVKSLIVISVDLLTQKAGANCCLLICVAVSPGGFLLQIQRNPKELIDEIQVCLQDFKNSIRLAENAG